MTNIVILGVLMLLGCFVVGAVLLVLASIWSAD